MIITLQPFNTGANIAWLPLLCCLLHDAHTVAGPATLANCLPCEPA